MSDQEDHPHHANKYLKAKLRIFGIDMTYQKTWVQFAICVSGVFFFHVSNGMAVERVFRQEGFDFGWFFTLVQFFSYAALATINQHLSGQGTFHHPPETVYRCAFLSFCMVTTIGLSNYSLQFVSYPFQQLLKSGKLIPVVLGSKLMFNKQYSWLEYLSVVFIILGLGLLGFEKASAEDEMSALLVESKQSFGMLLLTIAMFFEAFVGNYQEKLMKDFHLTQENLISSSYRAGTVMLITVCLLSGELFPAINFCLENPHVMFWLSLVSLSGYFGLIFVLSLLRLFDAFVTTTVTSTRKILSITLSFIFFPKPLNLNFIISAILVFWGLGIHIYVKNKAYIRELLGIDTPVSLG